MFFSSGITGQGLPPKTVCLTFDDGPGETSGAGPGPRTLELAGFLASQKIEATFFVIGEFASTRTEILLGLARMGHLIGNHTYNHTRLANRSGSFAADQISRTDAILSSIQQPLKFFRPPHGSWSPGVAGELNWTEVSSHLGPVMWDIDAADWRFWSDGRPARECAAAYQDRITSVGGGIMIMHDSSFESEIRSQNDTFETVKLMVDWLQQNAYSFVRLDALPQVREALRISSIIALQTATGHYLSPLGGGGGEVAANASSVGASEPLGVVELGDNKIALRCLSGLYISAENGGAGALLANAAHIRGSEVFTRVDMGGGKIALRCPNGQYISPGQGGGGNAFRVVRPGSDASGG